MINAGELVVVHRRSRLIGPLLAGQILGMIVIWLVDQRMNGKLSNPDATIHLFYIVVLLGSALYFFLMTTIVAKLINPVYLAIKDRQVDWTPILRTHCLVWAQPVKYEISGNRIVFAQAPGAGRTQVDPRTGLHYLPLPSTTFVKLLRLKQP